MLLGFFCWDNFFPNSGSYRVLVGFQRTGEFQESPQEFSATGTGQADSPPKPPEDQKRRGVKLHHVLLCAYGFYNVF